MTDSQSPGRFNETTVQVRSAMLHESERCDKRESRTVRTSVRCRNGDENVEMV